MSVGGRLVAAVVAAVVAGASMGGIGLVRATTPSSAVALVPITPCRVADTRVSSNVGDRSTPLGAGETMAVSMRSSAGNPRGGGSCDGVIPVEATAVSLNVTALRASAATYLTIWPAGVVMPTASSLNPVPGAPPTPNAVVTGLSGDDRFNVFNLQGEVHLVIDVNGYYVDHHHDDRYPTRTELAARDPLQVVIGAEEFVNESTSTIDRSIDRVEVESITGLGSCAGLYAPADLPHRATITRLRVRLVDHSVPEDVSVALMAVDLSSLDVQNLMALESAGSSPQLVTLVATPPFDQPTVDLTTHRYMVVACLPTGTQLADAVVNYTVP